MRVLIIFLLMGAAGTSGVQAAEQWPLFGGNYANHRYSPSQQISTENASSLSLAWRVETGRKASFQATPIVVGDVMYVSTPFNDVVALDAATGDLRWRYVHEHIHRDWCCGPANRGVAWYRGNIYMATVDGQLVSLDAASGELNWARPIVDRDAERVAGEREALAPLLGDAAFEGATVTGATGFGANMAPQVVDGKVLVGITGAGYGLHLDLDRDDSATALTVVGLSGGLEGLRGFLLAFDAEDGDELWRWYSVPGPEWSGEFTANTDYGVPLNRNIAAERHRAPKHEHTWRLGGGSIWTTPAVDKANNLVFIGTGNPSPQMNGDTRPGDNRDTVSLVALNLQTGERVWAYQQVPHDRWGYDVASPPVLLQITHKGKPRAAVAQASKTGWIFVHDRLTGELLFRSQPFVPQQNLFAPPSAMGVRVAPAILGGASWSPMAFVESSGLLFVAGIHHPATYFEKALQPTPEHPWDSYSYMELAQERWGTLSAIDASSGKLRWQLKRPDPLLGGVLATAGGLLFFGEGDGHFNALDARDGKVLWQHQSPYGVNAPPISYEVDERQYIAVAAGGNKLFGFATGDEILAFALNPDKALSLRASD